MSSSNIRSTRSRGFGADEEDPRTRGILPNTSCRHFRQRLRSARKVNVFQGLVIATGGVALLGVLMLMSMDVAAGNSNPSAIDRMKGMWESAVNFLGLPELLNRAVEQRGRGGRSLDDAATQHYCNQPLDTKTLFRLIGQQVLNQQQAMARMERTVSRQRQFQSLVLLGPPGVGKTLTVSALSHYFPWPGNIHSFSGAPCVPGEERDCAALRQVLAELSDCGTNLLLIDQLEPCDHHIVASYNKFLRDGLQRQSLLVLYVIDLEVELYGRQFELMQRELPADTTIVSFRLFGREELRDCLEHELQQESRVLGQDEQTRILGEALAKSCCAGCKDLREIVLKQGRAANAAEDAAAIN
ncbi:uncharacterized protein DMAD_05997 [Drosophila madeirensis]|uniref:AAA+ ATPase domain-containing protein n=1 Tax=Drosophila madeirensis TaxID=30013 RepID=A0AAU9FQ24_DROMD